MIYLNTPPCGRLVKHVDDFILDDVKHVNRFTLHINKIVYFDSILWSPIQKQVIMNGDTQEGFFMLDVGFFIVGVQLSFKV